LFVFVLLLYFFVFVFVFVFVFFLLFVFRFIFILCFCFGLSLLVVCFYFSLSFICFLVFPLFALFICCLVLTKTTFQGVMLINTSRGGLVDSSALVTALKTKKIGAAGLDVVEEEGDYVFEDHSGQAIADNMLSRLLSFPNVIVTGHQAFFTQEAVATIAAVTLDNALLFHKEGKTGKSHPNFVVPEY
jgi:hypothetical protein